MTKRQFAAVLAVAGFGLMLGAGTAAACDQGAMPHQGAAPLQVAHVEKNNNTVVFSVYAEGHDTTTEIEWDELHLGHVYPVS